jgi:hypothetical protein
MLNHKKDNVEKLVEDFPIVFNGKMPWCSHNGYGDGWDKLLRALCTELSKLLKEPGRVVPAQIKEKFGGLRFYIDWNKDVPLDADLWHEVRNKVDAVERLSTMICEECGELGRRRQGRWIQTLCEFHAEGRAEVSW